ncbi:O-antigen ligase family protein [Aldersonia sp. NBC_00410]|uniref:O-antigen ligase family protein n=1 Tax=Aldersonia sp. NBC_00410 TaxID=2975954 RepID=UPI002256B9FA|nr:O-antigen ligase family protein [Aldersonia sp. NBC_00410]MCX5041700.1 O-antigen ligase family protein [Aldersonia sp. NBC_00410]
MTMPRLASAPRLWKRANTDADLGEVEPKPRLVALLCFIVPALPAYEVLPGPLRGNGSPARLIAFMCFTLVVLAYFTTRKPRTRLRDVNPGVLIILLYFFLQLLTYATGLSLPGNAVIDSSKTRTLIVLVADVGVALYVCQTVRTVRQRSYVMGFLVAGLAFACFSGLLQGFTSLDIRALLVPPGFVEVIDASTLDDRGGALRVVGTSEHAIEFGVLAAITVPLAFHLARYAEKSLHRQLATIACVLAFVVMPSAVSRSGALALAVCMLIYMFTMRVRLLANVVIIGMGLLLMMKIAAPNSINALWATFAGSKDDDSVISRTDDYQAVAEQFKQHPWFGLGLGGYPPSVYRFLDNQWLQAVVQGGMIGVVAMSVLALGGAAGMTAGLRRARSMRERDQLYALGASFAGIMFSAFTFDLFSFQQATYVCFILFALLWSVRHSSAATATSTGVAPARPAGAR